MIKDLFYLLLFIIHILLYAGIFKRILLNVDDDKDLSSC